MKLLNAYAGIGGNRKLWDLPGVEITAVELDPQIAAIYQDFYPNDTVIVADAHEFLLANYENYDFIWASPPCPTHSVTNHFLNAQGVKRYPDMALYQEIILLQTFFKGKYCVENVKSYYEPLIKPQESGRHYFWANFLIPKMQPEKQIGRMNGRKAQLGVAQGVLRQNNLNKLGIDLSAYRVPDKKKLLRNCVNPEIGLAILQSALNLLNNSILKQFELFGETG